MKSYKIKRAARLIELSIALFALRYVWIEKYLIPSGTETDDMCQIYFGGISADMSFDFLSVAVYMMMIMIEVIMANEDSIADIFHNMDILLCRAGSRKRLYGYMMVKVIGYLIVIVTVNYLLFLISKQMVPQTEHVIYVVSELVVMLALDMIYIILYSLFRNDICYVLVLGLYILPILTDGFLLYKGVESWRYGKYDPLLTIIYNYVYSYSYTDVSMNYTVSTNVFTTVFVGCEWAYLLYELGIVIVLSVIAGATFVRTKRI